VQSPYSQAVVSILIGLGLLVWPPTKWRDNQEQRKKRLAELADGAPERYFEERRQLKAYGPRSGGPFRLFGFLMLVLGVAMLFL
jgi:hypothetical protein